MLSRYTSKSLKTQLLNLVFLTLLATGLGGCGASTTGVTGGGNAATASSETDDGGLSEIPFDIPVTIGKLQVNTIDATKTEAGNGGFDPAGLVKALVAGAATAVDGSFIHGEVGAATGDAEIVVLDINSEAQVRFTAEADGSFLLDISGTFDLTSEVHTFSLQESNGLSGADEEASAPIYISFNPSDSILDSALRFSPFNVTITNTLAEIDTEENFSPDNTGNVAFNITVDDVIRPALIPIRGGSATLIPNIDKNVLSQSYSSDGSFFIYKDDEPFLHHYDVATEADTVLDSSQANFRIFDLCSDDLTVIQADVQRLSLNDNEVIFLKVDLENLGGQTEVLFRKTGFTPIDITCTPTAGEGIAFLKQGTLYYAYLFTLEEANNPILLFKTKNAIDQIAMLPDNSGFVYEMTESNVKQLHQFTLSNKADATLTQGVANSFHPSISYGGNFVLFHRLAPSSFQIFAYEFSTGNTYQLTSEVQSLAPVASKDDNTFTYKYGEDFQVGVGNLDNLF